MTLVEVVIVVAVFGVILGTVLRRRSSGRMLLVAAVLALALLLAVYGPEIVRDLR